MKTINFILLAGVTILLGCQPNKKEKAEALFTDPVMQDEIFNAILSDSARLNDFFNKLHSQRNLPKPMHKWMMKKMCCASGTDTIMMCDESMKINMMRHMLRQTDRDSIFCKQIGDSVLRHTRLRKHLHQQMELGKQKKRGNQ